MSRGVLAILCSGSLLIAASGPVVTPNPYDQPAVITVRDWLLMNVHLDLLAHWDGTNLKLGPPRIMWDGKTSMFVARVDFGLDPSGAPVGKLKNDLTVSAIEIGAALLRWFPDVKSDQYRIEFRKFAWDKDMKPRYDVVGEYKSGMLTLR